MIDKTLSYAVVGASNNHEKYGYKVFKDLLEAGYSVIPINPNEESIDGVKVFPTLREALATKPIDVVITVVPPSITEKIVDEVLDVGIKNVWMQPGSENWTAVKKAESRGVHVVAGSCIMVERL